MTGGAVNAYYPGECGTGEIQVLIQIAAPSPVGRHSVAVSAAGTRHGNGVPWLQPELFG